MKGEHRRGRKTRQDRHRLLSHRPQTDRLARLQAPRHAPRSPASAPAAPGTTHPPRPCSSPPKATPGRPSSSACIERPGQLRLIIPHDPQPDRLAPQLAHRIRQDRRIAVMNRRRLAAARPGARSSSPVDRIATRTRRITLHPSPPDRRQYARFARSSERVPPRSTSSPRAMSVPAKLKPAPGVTGRTHQQACRRRSIRVCSTITTASAPRGIIAPVAISVAVPGSSTSRGSASRRQLFLVEPQHSGASRRSRQTCPPPARQSRPRSSDRTPARRRPPARPRPVPAQAPRRAPLPRPRARPPATTDRHRRSASSRSTTSRNWSCSSATVAPCRTCKIRPIRA